MEVRPGVDRRGRHLSNLLQSYDAARSSSKAPLGVGGKLNWRECGTSALVVLGDAA